MLSGMPQYYESDSEEYEGVEYENGSPVIYSEDECSEYQISSDEEVLVANNVKNLELNSTATIMSKTQQLQLNTNICNKSGVRDASLPLESKIA